MTLSSLKFNTQLKPGDKEILDKSKHPLIIIYFINTEHRIEGTPGYIITGDINTDIGIMDLFVGIVYLCSL